MAATLAIQKNSMVQSERHDRHLRNREPAWLSRLLTRKSRNHLRLETATSSNDHELTVPRTMTSQSAEDSSHKLITKKSKRRFSFVPRRVDETAKSNDNKVPAKEDDANTDAAPIPAPAAYVPKHAASDFGKMAIPTTYRDSMVILYNGSSEDKHQYRRHSQAYLGRSASQNAGALSKSGSAPNIDRKRMSVASNPFADDNFVQAAPTENLRTVSGRCRSSVTEYTSYSELQLPPRLSRKSVTAPRISSVHDESEVCIVTESANKETGTGPDQQTSQDLDTADQTPGFYNNYTAQSSNVRAARFAATLLPSSEPATSLAGHRESFSDIDLAWRKSRHSTVEDRGRNKRRSVIVHLGMKVTEYIKPTTMPDNSVPAVQQISVIRNGR